MNRAEKLLPRALYGPLRNGAANVFNAVFDRIHDPRDARSPHDATVSDIVEHLATSGIGSGATLLVHSSWGRVKNDSVGIKELIGALQELVGPTGTLVMPAFPVNQEKKNRFSAKSTPSGAGMLSEVFRRGPGTLRSININHSVCARGPNAEFLTRDHHKCVTSWDEASPYYRLGKLENSWVVGLGVGFRLKTATPLHCVESILREEVSYFSSLFPAFREYEYVDMLGNSGRHRFLSRRGLICPAKLARYFSADELVEKCVKGLDVYSIRSSTLIDRAISLGRQGKTMYIWPIPYPWRFRVSKG